jgi:hypothetical protein
MAGSKMALPFLFTSNIQIASTYPYFLITEKAAISRSYLKLNKIKIDASNHGGQCDSDHLYLMEFYFSHQPPVLERCAHF